MRPALIAPMLLVFLALLVWGLWGKPGVLMSPCWAKTSENVGLPRAQLTAVITTAVHLPQVMNDYYFAFGTRLTYDSSNDTQPDLSPDGSTVVFIGDHDGLSDVFRLEIAGGRVVNLTRSPSAQEDTPVFSPDGSTIAFASDRAGDWDIYLMDADGANVRRAVGYTGTDELQPAFTPDGSALIFASNRAGGNWDIYLAPIGSETWTRLTTDPAADRFPSASRDGATIAFRSEREGNSEIYLMDADGSNVRRATNDPAYDGYPSIAPDGSGLVFASWRSGATNLYGANPSGQGLVAFESRPGWQMDTPRVSKDGHSLLYSARPASGAFDVYMRPYNSPLFSIAERGVASLQNHCDWEAGTLVFGWAKAWRTTADDHYLRWTRNWIDGCISTKTTITHVNDGLLGYAALVAYEADGKPEHLVFAQQVADYFMHTATRTADGTLTHEDDTVWDDTLIGVVPFLVEMSRVRADSLYLEEAITQTIKHANHLQDPISGLYHHAWDEHRNGLLGPVYWGRGNGWVLLADVEILSAMPVTHPLRSAVLSVMQKQAAGLKPLQDPGGLWHTVVTRSDFYLESSASALIGYAFRRGAQEGWLDPSVYLSAARTATIGIWRHVLADGTVTDVSDPTGPMLTEADYNAVLHNNIQLYGQGVALLLESPHTP